MRKLVFIICENKDADQLCGNRAADQCVPLNLQWLYSSVCVRPGRKPRRQVLHDAAHILVYLSISKFSSYIHYILK